MRGDDRVSRMAAVLVMAAGGKISIDLDLIANARFIRLHQTDDPRTNKVHYTATYDREGQGPIVDNDDVVIEHMKILPSNKGSHTR
jgi:hypothetical protein